MKYLTKLLIAFGLFGYPLAIQSQNSVSAAGGDASGAGGTSSYTIGQIIYITCTGTSGSMAHGVQQPYEISVITGLEEAKDLNIICSVYPNPVNDILTLKIGNWDKKNLSYQLYDSRGNLLENKKVSVAETVVSMGNRATGTYFLKLTDSLKEIKVFKIIKN